LRLSYFKYLVNKIGNIGAKYLGLGLSKLIKLTYLYFDIGNIV
jgi:hypothetical protein